MTKKIFGGFTMKISGLVNTLNFGNSNMYVSQRYNTAPVTKVKHVQRQNYSINRTVNRELSRSMANMGEIAMSISNKSVVLPNGAVFVGTIIDTFA